MSSAIKNPRAPGSVVAGRVQNRTRRSAPVQSHPYRETHPSRKAFPVLVAARTTLPIRLARGRSEPEAPQARGVAPAQGLIASATNSTRLFTSTPSS